VRIVHKTNSRTKKPRAPLGTIRVGAPLERLATDILGPLQLTARGNRYILVATDHFTKWTAIFPVPDQTANTCAEKLLNDVISSFGCPLTIHSDQGRNSESTKYRYQAVKQKEQSKLKSKRQDYNMK